VQQPCIENRPKPFEALQNIFSFQERKLIIKIYDKIEGFEYGKFVHIMDPEGNKIELWEPVDQVFTDMYEGKTTH